MRIKRGCRQNLTLGSDICFYVTQRTRMIDSDQEEVLSLSHRTASESVPIFAEWPVVQLAGQECYAFIPEQILLATEFRKTLV